MSNSLHGADIPSVDRFSPHVIASMLFLYDARTSLMTRIIRHLLGSHTRGSAIRMSPTPLHKEGTLTYLPDLDLLRQ
jgi:hypothetical protein